VAEYLTYERNEDGIISEVNPERIFIERTTTPYSTARRGPDATGMNMSGVENLENVVEQAQIDVARYLAPEEGEARRNYAEQAYRRGDYGENLSDILETKSED